MLLAGSLSAQEKEYTGQGGQVPDNDPDGARFEIFVAESGPIVSFLDVNLFDFSHTWAGDLAIYITHKDTGTQVVLLDRPGVPESTFGDSADFSGDYTWTDAGFVYNADVFADFVPTDRNYGPVSGHLSDFVGEDKHGTWSLRIVDNAGGDTGGISSWSFTVVNPTPGALMLMGTAGLFGTRRRRRA
jgi:subtilisin-like proprotein convertase family protein